MSGALKESNPWAPDLDVTVPLEDGTIIDVKPQSFVDSNEPTITVTQQPVNGTVTPGGDAPGLLVANLAQEGPDEARYTVEDTRGFVSAPAILRLEGVSQEPDPDPAEFDIFRTPFTSASAWNIPIGDEAQYEGTNDPETSDWLKMSNLSMPGDLGWGVGTYPIAGAFTVESSPSDSLFVVADNGQGPGIGVPSPAIRIPEVCKTLTWTSNDRVVVIYDPSAQMAYEFFNFRWTGSNYEARLGRPHSAVGLGHGTQPGDRVGSSAAGVSLFAGHISLEMMTPGVEFTQALGVTIPRAQGGVSNPNNCLRLANSDTRLPATNIDGYLQELNTGNITFGSVFALPRDVNISGLGLSELGERIANCARNRGFIVVDTGGCGGGNVRTRQGMNASHRTAIIDAMNIIVPRMRRVVENGWFQGQTVRGGGTPLAQNYGVTS